MWLTLFLLILIPLLLCLGIAWLFRREFKAIRLRNHPFTCQRCGRCCRFQVLLCRSEIERLEKGGFSRDDFVASRFGMSFLKRDEDGNCVFLRTEDSECSIASANINSEEADKAAGGGCVCMNYANRPDTCRRYPNIRIGLIRGKDPRCKAVQDDAHS